MIRKSSIRSLLIISIALCSGFAASLSAYSAFAAATCPQQMISYWRFEETAGPTYADFAGGHDAACPPTASCPVSSTGRIGKAQVFNGGTAGLSVPASGAFDWGAIDSFSIEFWMKADGACLGNQVIIGRDDASTQLHWWVGCWDNTGVAAFRLTDKSGHSALVFGSTDLTDGRWHHVTAVRDGSASQNRLYVDGILEGSTNIIYSFGFDSAIAALNIGWLNLTPFYHFAGTLDELAIYGRPLADSEIKQHYTDGAVGLGWGYCPDCATSVRIMPLGDSITRGSAVDPPDPNTVVGYRQKLNLDLRAAGYDVDFVGSLTDGDAAAPPFDTAHEGHGGWHASGGTYGGIAPNVGGFLQNNPADVVLLHIGTNDISSGTQNPADIGTILDNIDAYSKDVAVVLARIINRTDTAAKELATTQFNDAVENLAKTRITNGDKIIIVDQEHALNYSTDMADIVHPNPTGYEKMSDVWLNALNNFLPMCSPVAPFICSSPVTNAYVGWHYSYSVDATGNPAPGFSLLAFPSGMTINPVTGIIQWVPSAQGSYNVSVQANNGVGTPDTQSFAISVVSPPPCPANITHYWKLDEAGGTSYADFYGGDAATCTDCPAPLTGIVNGAMLFNASSRLNARDDDTFDWNIGDSFSIELWMKTDSTSTCTGNQVFVGRYDSATSLQWWLGCNNTGDKAGFYLRDKAGNWAKANGVKDLTDGLWHHIAATRDAVAGTINVYVDGELESSVSASYATGFDSKTAPVNIGWLNTTPYFNFIGGIDEVAIYGRALSEREILQHYSAGLSAHGFCDVLAPSFVSTPQANALVGVPYSYTASAIGNPAPSYSLTTAPSGMTINPATGLISWTPGTKGNYNVTVKANNGVGTPATQSFGITVLDASTYPIMLKTVPYMLLQDAFAAVSENGDTLKIRAGEYSFGAATYGNPFTLLLAGGYDSAFSNNTGAFTTIKGSLTIQKGAVTVKNIVIR